jgi:c-di-GMP-binding flagellar brake protein YcgR
MKDSNEFAENAVAQSFSISCGTQVIFELENISLRFNSVVVGCSINEYVLIKIPRSVSMSLIMPKLAKGNRIVVRFLDDGRVYGFEANILGVMTSPVRFIIISYPKIVSQHELRRKQRYHCIIPGKIEKGSDQIPAIMVDISNEGCGITIKAHASPVRPEFKIDEAVTFHFVLPGSEKNLLLSGNIKNLNQDNMETSLGIKFTDVAEELKNTINGYISFMSMAG